MPKFQVLPARPPKPVIDGFREALNLSRQTLEQANGWFKKNPNFIQQFDLTDTVKRAADEMKLDVSDLWPLFSLVGNVGLLVQDDSKLPPLLDDLRALGFSDSQLANFEVLMQGLRFPEGALSTKTVDALTTGLSKVVDFNAVCDLRGVFEANPDSTEPDDKVQHLMALVPTAIITLDIQEESGRTESVTVQFSEDELATFLKKVTRVTLQLAQLSTQAGKIRQS